MVEKITTIKNPLTIIAIFAGIAEITGTCVLPLLTESNQASYIWFLMIFPCMLILLFFATLNWNHKVLYAPSDYKDEENFVRTLTKATRQEASKKILDELSEIEHPLTGRGDQDEPEKATSHEEDSNSHDPEKSSPHLLSVPNKNTFGVKSKQLLNATAAHVFVLGALEKLYGRPIKRNMALRDPLNHNADAIVFDGVVFNSNEFIAIEVRYIPENAYGSIMETIEKTILSIIEMEQRLPTHIQNIFKLNLFIVLESNMEIEDEIRGQFDYAIGVTPFDVDLHVNTFDEVKRGIIDV